MEKTKIKFRWVVAGLLLAFALPVSFAQAQSIAVDFESDPLFEVTNFMPGDVVRGDVIVTNNTEVGQIISTEAININDKDGLANEMNIRIIEGLNVLYTNSFATFLSSGGVNLSSLASSRNTIYTYEISFLSASEDHQGSSLGFDLCIGFQGGNLQCGDTVVGSPELQSSPSSGSGGSGGVGSPSQLSIFNEQSSVVNVGNPDSSNGNVLITWDTNLLSTSQVIYGLASGAPYTLDLNLPNFGYPFGTTEDPIKVLHHFVNVGGLIPGETYVFRTVSRASPPTISFEREFTVAYALASSPNSGESTSAQNVFSIGSDSSDSSDSSWSSDSQLSSSGDTSAPLNGFSSNQETSNHSEISPTQDSQNSNLSAAALSGLPDWLSKLFSAKYVVIFAAFLMLIYFIWLFVLKVYFRHRME